MLLRFTLYAISLTVATNGQAVAPPGGCLVCGDGKVVTAPDAIFSFPEQPVVPCSTLQEAGLRGDVPLAQCGFLASLIPDCMCARGDLPVDPSPAPVPAPTPSPVPNPTAAPLPPPTPVPLHPTPALLAPTGGGGGPIPCPDVPATGCSICGPGLCVTDFDAIFSFPDQPAVPCGTLEQAGQDGAVPLDQCPFLPGIVGILCSCASEVPGGPVDPPLTLAPVPEPTAAPLTLVPVPELPPPNACPNVPPGGCSICGEGKCVTDPDGIFVFPGQPIVPCGLLQDAGYDGTITPEQCPLLPERIRDGCGCATSLPPSMPSTSSPTPPSGGPPSGAPVSEGDDDDDSSGDGMMGKDNSGSKDKGMGKSKKEMGMGMRRLAGGSAKILDAITEESNSHPQRISVVRGQ